MDRTQLDSMLNHIQKNWTESVLPSLCDFIRIPAQSPGFDPDWEERGELDQAIELFQTWLDSCLLYTSPSPRDKRQSRMPSSA